VVVVTQLPLRLLRARQRVRRTTNRALGRLRTAPYIRKWLVLGVLIGVVAGVGALVFYSALQAATHYLLGSAGGFHPATTAGEGGVHPAGGFARRWAVPVVVGAGGLVSGLLVFLLAPEAEGHGTDAAIAAVHHNPTGMRARVTAVKIVASAVTIGSGGSGGREGPTAQISASFGSMLARALNLSPADARIAVSTGIASGIGAIFRAPLGGAVLGAEIVYRDDVETEALVPSVVASIVAFAVFGSVYGYAPIFGYHTEYRFAHAGDLAWFAVLGLLAGGMGRLYASTFYRVNAAFRRLRLPAAGKPAVAGLAVGALGLAVPGVLGTGYGAVQQTLDAHRLTEATLALVLVLPFMKILATSLTIGSGGSGGIFGPGMVIGGATGAAVWRLLTDAQLPLVPHTPVPYVIVGMIACFGSIAHAPLAVTLMVAEMTGSLSLLAPAMVAIALAILVVGDATIYRSQLRNRAESPAHRLSLGLPLAATVPIADVMATPRLVLRASTTVDEALAALDNAHLPGAPVVNGDGAFIGSLHRDGVPPREQAEDDEAPTVGRIADPNAITVAADGHLDAALEALAVSHGDWVPVLDQTSRVVGIIGTGDLVRGYQLALRASIRRLGRAAKGSILVEHTVSDAAPAIGRRVADLSLPRHTVIVAVLRHGALLFADADTTLQPGDMVSALTRIGDEPVLRVLFADPIVAADETGGQPPDALI
jgi:H+/Cl- antiporter ClcA